ATVVSTLVLVVVVLEHAAELNQVLALQPRHVVAERVVVAVPVTGTRLLRVDVVRKQCVGRVFATWLQSSTQTGKLHGTTLRAPRPVIAQVVVGEVVGDVVGQLTRESGNQVPRLLWTAGERRRRPQ